MCPLEWESKSESHLHEGGQGINTKSRPQSVGLMGTNHEIVLMAGHDSTCPNETWYCKVSWDGRMKGHEKGKTGIQSASSHSPKARCLPGQLWYLEIKTWTKIVVCCCYCSSVGTQSLEATLLQASTRMPTLVSGPT
jgi:hypothetical protein